jgi:hypothetical protein
VRPDGERRWHRKPSIGKHLSHLLLLRIRVHDRKTQNDTIQLDDVDDAPTSLSRQRASADCIARAFLVERHCKLTACRREEGCATAGGDRVARRIARSQRGEQQTLSDRALTNQLRTRGLVPFSDPVCDELSHRQRWRCSIPRVPERPS